VIHEHDDLILASAAIDFELTSDEADRLRRAVADCPVCAERASAYRRQFQALAELPRLEPTDAMRRRVMTAAISGRPSQTRTPVLLLAAALVIGALLALVAAAAGGAFRERSLAEYPPIDESVNPVASAIAIASREPVTVASPPADPGPGGRPTTFGSDTIAAVVSNNLRLRSQPRIAADSIKFEPFLKVGDRLFVVDGPVTATNHDWYQVATWRPSDPTATWPIGWVASADIDGTAWIGTAATACPATPTVAELAGMNRYEALACYGHRAIALRALVSGTEPGDPCPAGDPSTACLGGPTWLAGIGGRSAALDGSDPGASPERAILAFARDPAGQVPESDLPNGRMVTLEGAFDPPAAASCKIEGTPASVSTVTVTDAILRCRTTFVVSSAAPDPAYLTLQRAATTTTPGLRVRSLPLVDDSSERYAPLLDQGTHLFVLAGPVIGSGYDWYRVIAPAVTRADGQSMTGWVAVAGKTGEIWAKDLDLGCPAATGLVRLADLQRLATGPAPDGGLSCFVRTTITTRANVHLDCGRVVPGSTDRRDWIVSPSWPSFVMTDGSAIVDGRVAPALVASVCNIAQEGQDGTWNIEGHFADADAAYCAPSGSSESAALAASYRCSTVFVVTMALRN
jgi:hypothetical protein